MNIQEMSFDSWMNQVDKYCERITSMSIYDMSDYHYRDLYKAGVDPEEAAMEALENDDIGRSLLEELGMI